MAAAFIGMNLAGVAEVVMNAFVVAEADGVRMAGDESIHFAPYGRRFQSR